MLPCADGPFDPPLDPVCSPDDFADSYNYREFFLDEPSEPKIKNFARFSGWVRTPQNSASSFSFYINDVRQSRVTFYPRPDVPFGKDMNVFGWWFACEVGQMPSNEHGAFVFRFCEAGFQDEKRYFRLRKKGEERPPLMFFMHIPKTAGTSLRAAIEGSYEPQKSLFVYDDPMYFHAAGLEYLSHTAFDELKVVCGHFYYGVHKYTSVPYKYVSFLREPYDF